MMIIICDRCGNRVEAKDPQTTLEGSYSQWAPNAQQANVTQRHVDLCGPCTGLLLDFMAKRQVLAS